MIYIIQFVKSLCLLDQERIIVIRQATTVSRKTYDIEYTALDFYACKEGRGISKAYRRRKMQLLPSSDSIFPDKQLKMVQ